MAEKPSWLERLGDYMQERVIPEVGQMLDHKISQGAAELGQALNSQSDAYVPYGAGQQPLEVEGPSVSYLDKIREASQGVGRDQDHGLDR